MKQITHFILSGCFLMMINSFSLAQGSTNVPVSLSANSGLLNGGVDSRGRPSPDSRGWTDPALNHNKLLQQNSNGMKLIGAYKVTGSSFLFGEHHLGDIFAPEVKAYNIYISYNTFNQEVEFYSKGNPDIPLIREPGTLDSFIFHQDFGYGITSNLKFVYGSLLGVKDKYYFQEICTGKRFSLYKRYKSDLGYVSTNYVQSELRQFDLQIEYYYTDTANKGMKKIKPNAASVIKEFKDIKDPGSVAIVDEFTANPENAFRKVFEYLNN